LKASTKIAKESDEPLTKNPIIGLAGCCARAVSVQATALPTSVMNVRRLIVVAAAVAQHRSSYRFEASLKGAELPQRPLWVKSKHVQRKRPCPLSANSGHSLSFIRLPCRRAGIEAKLPFKVHPHMLRHATGFALANKGTDTRTLQAYLGHRRIQSTVRYTELAPGRFKNLWR
jgi:integrase